MVEGELSSAENKEVTGYEEVMAARRRILVFRERGKIGWRYIGEVIDRPSPTTSGIAEGLHSGADALTDVIVGGVQLTYRELDQALKREIAQLESRFGKRN